ncbi:MAG: hypothetical protein HC804_02340 [Anaerolineae bacterium]|nr:hypothetical protein [Anaerolineae bacterium]
MKPKLTTILSDLINGRLSTGTLSGGLMLQFKAADDDNPENRLAAIRVGVSVGTVELGTLRRDLEAILPPARPCIWTASRPSSGKTAVHAITAFFAGR